MTKDQFKPEENYDEFYAGHKFQPLDEHTSLNVDLVLPRAGWALDVAQEIGAKSLLDLCCLDGFVSLTLARKLGLRAVGIDLSEPGIALANERAKKHSLNATFIQAPVESALEDGAAKFDLCVLFEAIEHFKDVDKVMAVIKTHLKPGGTLLVSTPDAEGKYGIPNIQDVCHLWVWSTRATNDLPSYPEDSPITKPIRSLPDYLTKQGFRVEENEVWDDLVCVRAVMLD